MTTGKNRFVREGLEVLDCSRTKGWFEVTGKFEGDDLQFVARTTSFSFFRVVVLEELASQRSVYRVMTATAPEDDGNYPPFPHPEALIEETVSAVSECGGAIQAKVDRLGVGYVQFTACGTDALLCEFLDHIFAQLERRGFTLGQEATSPNLE
ncbi:hypothetical protein LAZ40_04385 [Cereibacter sphaeroides]|uniref:hypothetical protein n=1 Tax=Cereibacter sphaeroides TaxID=1063 RepID=UPI001F45B41C|nr:hypothetical protein [Cereibacter sphaeroides]MCE6958293.1 hypothetical protein [Cereibacter sphaeroides]MCE6971903.1 hypothetical protein [Cereibacter sphaeroides]